MKDQRGRVAVVTGGARGIGKAIVERLARDGARVAVLDKDEDGAHAAAAAVGGVGFGCDVTDAEGMLEIAERVTAELGPSSVLVANVGWTPNKPFLELRPDEREAVIQVNYSGALNACAAFLPGMIAGEFGRVVLISSDAARIGTPKETVYAGAKAALFGFGKSLALEVARSGITVNIVSPGSTDTELVRDMLTAEQIERRVKANPMRRLARPEEIAGAVAFFVGDDAAFVTGQVLSVNGGMTRVG